MEFNDIPWNCYVHGIVMEFRCDSMDLPSKGLAYGVQVASSRSEIFWVLFGGLVVVGAVQLWKILKKMYVEIAQIRSSLTSSTGNHIYMQRGILTKLGMMEWRSMDGQYTSEEFQRVVGQMLEPGRLRNGAEIYSQMQRPMTLLSRHMQRDAVVEAAMEAPCQRPGLFSTLATQF